MRGGRIERRGVFMLDEPKLNILLLPFPASTSNHNYFIEFCGGVNVITFLVCLEYKKTLKIIISVVVTVGIISFSNCHT